MDRNADVDSTLVFEKEILDAVYEKVSPSVVAILLDPISTGFIAKNNSTHHLIAVETSLLGLDPDVSKIRIRYSDGVVSCVDRIDHIPGRIISVLYSPHLGKSRAAVEFEDLQDEECQKIVTVFPYNANQMLFKGYITLPDCTSETRSGFTVPGSEDFFMFTCPISAGYRADKNVDREAKTKFFRRIIGAAVFNLRGKVVGRIDECGTAHTIKYAIKSSVFRSHFDSPGCLDLQETEEKMNCITNKEREPVPTVKKAKDRKKAKTKADEEKNKPSTSVRHLAVPCVRADWAKIIPIIIQCYSHGGHTIIFTETKLFASELSGLIPGSRSLDGTFQPKVVAEFRSGKFLILVATYLAMQTLDINDVQLIIQCALPHDVQAYMQRTGGMGNSGIAVMLFEPTDESVLTRIERESEVKLERVSNVVQSAGIEAADAIAKMPESVITVFRQQAETLLSSPGMSIVGLLTKALAKIVGYTKEKKRSLLHSLEDFTTLHIKIDTSMRTPKDALHRLRLFISQDKLPKFSMALTADRQGAVFDVPSEQVQEYLQGQDNVWGVKIDEVIKLPALQEGEWSRGNSGGSRLGNEAADAIASVSDSVIPLFEEQALQLLHSSSGIQPADLLAKALAKAVGYTGMKKSSLLSFENCTTLKLTTDSTISTPSHVLSILQRFKPEKRLSNVQGLALTADGTGAVFDVPSAEVQYYLQGAENAPDVTLSEVQELPALQKMDQQSKGAGSRHSGSGRGGGGRGGLSGRRRGGGGRFSRR